MIDFEKKLSSSLKEIELEEYNVWRVSNEEEYHDAKFAIVDLLNEKFGTHFNHENWLHYKESDEVVYFLNEAGNNAFHYGGFPFKFHLWFGKKGFVIGISQEKEFNAVEINTNKVFQTEGRGFEFYRNCRSVVFFDDMAHLFAVSIHH